MIRTKLLLPAVFAFITTALGEDLTCDGEYSRNGKWCYKLSSAVGTFAEADENCKSSGGNVASIHSEEENFHIASFGVEVFIGLEYHSPAKNFSWTDGTLFDFNKWDEYYPMSPQFYGDCVKMQKSGKWVNFECDWKAQYVCKKAATNLQCPVRPNNQFFVSGEVTSPGYPENYIAGLSCTYELLVANDRSVKIEISEMVLGDGDTIEIFSRLVADNAYRIAVVSGNLTGEPMTYTTSEGENKMLVKFTSKSQNGGYWKFEFQKGGCERGWIDGSGIALDLCYKVHNDPTSFSDAKMECEREGAQLISIHNGFQDTFIRENLGKKVDGIWRELWLGIVYNHGSWKWTDGSKLQYTHWMIGDEPSEGDCAKISTYGAWEIVACNLIAAYPVCYKP